MKSAYFLKYIYWKWVSNRNYLKSDVYFSFIFEKKMIVNKEFWKDLYCVYTYINNSYVNKIFSIEEFSKSIRYITIENNKKLIKGF